MQKIQKLLICQVNVALIVHCLGHASVRYWQL